MPLPHWLEYTESWARIVGAFATPVVIAFVGYYAQRAIQAPQLDSQYVQIATNILKEPNNPGDKDNNSLRRWAVEMLNKHSPVKFESVDPNLSSALAEGMRLVSNEYFDPVYSDGDYNTLACKPKDFALAVPPNQDPNSASVYEFVASKNGIYKVGLGGMRLGDSRTAIGKLELQVQSLGTEHIRKVELSVDGGFGGGVVELQAGDKIRVFNPEDFPMSGRIQYWIFRGSRPNN